MKSVDKGPMESFSPEETYDIGRRLGQLAEPGDIVTLSGDLGTGKTVFAKGFAAGLGVADDVTSPTFTIIKEYRDGRLPLAHFDAYRIADPDEMYAIGYEDYLSGDFVCLIEWPEMIEELIPGDAIGVRLEKDLEKGFDYRRIILDRG